MPISVTTTMRRSLNDRDMTPIIEAFRTQLQSALGMPADQDLININVAEYGYSQGAILSLTPTAAFEINVVSARSWNLKNVGNNAQYDSEASDLFFGEDRTIVNVYCRSTSTSPLLNAELALDYVGTLEAPISHSLIVEKSDSHKPIAIVKNNSILILWNIYQTAGSGYIPHHYAALRIILQEAIPMIVQHGLAPAITDYKEHVKASVIQQANTYQEALYSKMLTDTNGAIQRESANVISYSQALMTSQAAYRDALVMKEALVSTKKVPGFDANAQVQGIINLLETGKFEKITLSDSGFSGDTGPIVIHWEGDTFLMGKYRVMIDRTNTTYRGPSIIVNGLENQADRFAGYCHPHVAGGAPCFGNISEAVYKLAGWMKVADCLSLIHSWLQEYNDANPYCTLERMMDGDEDFEEDHDSEEDNPCRHCDSQATRYCAMECSEYNEHTGPWEFDCENDCADFGTEGCWTCDRNAGWSVSNPCCDCEDQMPGGEFDEAGELIDGTENYDVCRNEDCEWHTARRNHYGRSSVNA